MLKPGDKAPEFKVKTHQGKDVTLSDFKGKNVILWFYPKADTPGCTAEGCGFRDRISQFEKKNTVVLGVSFDTVDENAKFAEKFHFPFPLLCDTERKIGMAYGACATATDGHAQRIGYVIDGTGKIKQAHPKVDAKSFPETVLAEI
jgi:thioredoxin-dependent peroxiredoxin